MFLQIGGFLLLTGFSGVLVGGIYLGRRVARLAALKGKLEEAKVLQQLQVAEHQVLVEAHTQNLQVLALGEGESTKLKQTVDDIPEKTKAARYEDIDHPLLSKEEWVAKQRDDSRAKDGEWVPA